MGYTLVNLKEVEDVAPSIGAAPNLEARFPTKQLELQKLAMSYQRLAPNVRAPFAHRQKQQEEVYVILAGGGRMKADDEIVQVRRWDAVRVPPETTRAFEAGPEGLEFLAFGAPSTPGGPSGDGEIVEGWWID